MPAFPPILVTVGTSPVQLLPPNAYRTQYLIVFPSSAKIAGNTGIIYVGVGQVPTATGGVGQFGHSMLGGETFGETAQYPSFAVTKDAIYAVASIASQIVEVYEVV